jgi:predicted O-methyltransferase YrrM
MTAEAIGRVLKIHDHYLTPLLKSLVSVGLLRTANHRYGNTSLAEKYFIEERSIYWTRQFSAECVQDYEALTVLEKTLASGKNYSTIKRLKKRDYVESMKRNPRQAEDFTQMLFYLHQNDAEALASYLDLSHHRRVLDVAGGSGVMSIALAKKNPHLRAAILDIAPVCEIASDNVRRAGLARRIATLPGDIREALPKGYDVILLCDLGDRSRQLLKNAYHSLPPNGLVVLADRYLADNGTKPLDRLLEYFVGSSFGLATRAVMVEAVKACGFRAVRARNVYRDVWYITGVKPGRMP